MADETESLKCNTVALIQDLLSLLNHYSVVSINVPPTKLSDWLHMTSINPSTLNNLTLQSIK